MNYQISRNGQIIGTYSHFDVMKGLTDGTFLHSDYYWTSGMTEWKRLSELSFAAAAPQVAAQPKAISSSDKQAIADGGKSSASMLKRVLVNMGIVLMPYVAWYWVYFDQQLSYKKKVKVYFTIWLVLLMLMATRDFRSSSGPGDYATSRAKDDAFRKEEIVLYAQKLVIQTLKAPSTAKFSSVSESYGEMIGSNETKKFYWCDGWVDSQNVYGAMVRTKWSMCFSVRNLDGRVRFEDEYHNFNGFELGTMPPECLEWYRSHGGS